MGRLNYLSIVPRVIDQDRVLLMLPFGAQTADAAELSMGLWRSGFKDNGWLVLVPFRDEGENLLFEPSETRFPEFLLQARQRFDLQDARLHLLGICHGGRTAFRIATRMPEEFRSLSVMPGFPHRGDPLVRLRGMAVNFVLGERDPMRAKSEQAYRKLQRLAVDVYLQLQKGEGHEAYEHLEFNELRRILERVA